MKLFKKEKNFNISIEIKSETEESAKQVQKYLTEKEIFFTCSKNFGDSIYITIKNPTHSTIEILNNSKYLHS